MTKWVRVSRRARCPICESDSWCGVSADGSVVHCMRSQSDHVVEKGGWIHRLTDPKPIYEKPVREAEPCKDFGAYIKDLRQRGSPSQLELLAGRLGVSAISLDSLSACYSVKDRAWAFPMRDALENVIGVRLRADNGTKWAVKGSKQGLFYDTFLAPDKDRILYVCEGPTDTAAMLTLGLPAVGRAACLGQADLLKTLCSARGFRKIVVVADNDEAKARPDGSFWYPGREGAERLIKELRMWSKLILTPAKDIRAWLQSGATIESLRCLENQQVWRGA